jgi:hypothetical protein
MRGAFLLELLANAVQQFLSLSIFVKLRIVRAGFHEGSLPDAISERKDDPKLFPSERLLI